MREKLDRYLRRPERQAEGSAARAILLCVIGTAIIVLGLFVLITTVMGVKSTTLVELVFNMLLTLAMVLLGVLCFVIVRKGYSPKLGAIIGVLLMITGLAVAYDAFGVFLHIHESVMINHAVFSLLLILSGLILLATSRSRA